VGQKINHAIGVGIRERLEQNSIHYREDGCVGSDTEREGSNSTDGEAGVFHKHLKRVSYLIPETAHGFDSASNSQGKISSMHGTRGNSTSSG
jgi:hypothetical protein